MANFEKVSRFFDGVALLVLLAAGALLFISYDSAGYLVTGNQAAARALADQSLSQLVTSQHAPGYPLFLWFTHKLFGSATGVPLFQFGLFFLAVLLFSRGLSQFGMRRLTALVAALALLPVDLIRDYGQALQPDALTAAVCIALLGLLFHLAAPGNRLQGKRRIFTWVVMAFLPLVAITLKPVALFMLPLLWLLAFLLLWPLSLEHDWKWGRKLRFLIALVVLTTLPLGLWCGAKIATGSADGAKRMSILLAGTMGPLLQTSMLDGLADGQKATAEQVVAARTALVAQRQATSQPVELVSSNDQGVINHHRWATDVTSYRVNQQAVRNLLQAKVAPQADVQTAGDEATHTEDSPEANVEKAEVEETIVEAKPVTPRDLMQLWVAVAQQYPLDLLMRSYHAMRSIMQQLFSHHAYISAVAMLALILIPLGWILRPSRRMSPHVRLLMLTGLLFFLLTSAMLALLTVPEARTVAGASLLLPSGLAVLLLRQFYDPEA
uniref:Uncharacterized protein n=1 Tax=Magnetococcus massalia (strain MO-1) TaxID=451514 RepID=A0A1S7LKX6_MAGMO|nr:membrane protein of unknown function [Candidatus Magnetococcus massalia]